MSWRVLLLCSLFLLLPASGFADRSPVRARKPGTDQFGDPLPEGAIARLGSIRFKHDTLDVRCVAFSPDSKLIASGGGDSTVRVWETDGGRPVAVLRGHEGAVAVDFSPDGRRLASYGRKALILWEVGSWRKRIITKRRVPLLPDDIRPRHIRFTNDGDGILLSDGRYLYRWRVKDGKREAAVRSPGIRGFDLHPDGKRIFAVGKGYHDRLRIYNVADLSLIASHANDESTGHDIAIFKDGKQAAIAAEFVSSKKQRQCEIIWDLEKVTPVLPRKLKTYSFSKAVAVSPDGDWIAGSWGGDTVLIADATTERVVRVIQNIRSVHDLAFSPDGKLLATAGLRVRLWRVGKWTEVGSDELLTPVLQARLCDGGRVINVGGALYDLRGNLLKSADSRRMNLAVATDYERIVPSFIPTRIFEGPQGRLLVREWSRWGHSVVMRDFKTGRELLRHETRRRIVPSKDWQNFSRQSGVNFRLPISGIESTRLSEDGRRLLILYSHSNPGYSVYNVADGHLVTARVSIPEENGVGVDIDAAAISPDGGLVAALSRYRSKVYVWNAGHNRKVKTGRLLHRLPWMNRGSSDSFYIYFSPNGRYLTGIANLPANRKRKLPPLYVWDTHSGRVLQKFPDCAASWRMNKPIFSPDGNLLASYHQDGDVHVIRVHEVASGRKHAEIQLEGSSHARIPACFSRDSRYLAIGDAHLFVCDMRNGKLLLKSERIEGGHYVVFRISADGRWVATGSKGGHIEIWDIKAGKRIFERRPNHHRIDAIVFTAKGTRLISIQQNRTALVWDLTALGKAR